MSEFGDNTLTPFEVVDARAAARAASEQQRLVEDAIRDRSRELAEAERAYRELLTKRIFHLHTNEGVAWTACETMARGETDVAELREARDIAKGLLGSVSQQGFRYGADRRDLHQLIVWSQRRDLRTDAPPEWDPKTGEVVTYPRVAA
jgi:hypothetical protein